MLLLTVIDQSLALYAVAIETLIPWTRMSVSIYSVCMQTVNGSIAVTYYSLARLV